MILRFKKKRKKFSPFQTSDSSRYTDLQKKKIEFKCKAADTLT